MNIVTSNGIPGLEHLSYSRMQAFLTCGLKFRFNYIDHIRPAFTPAPLAFGVAFHEAVEEALAGLMVGAMPAVADLVAVVDRSLNEQNAETPIQFQDEGGKDAMLELATRMLTAWTAWPRPAGRILAIEQSFELTLGAGLPPLVGRIDLVTDEPDAIVVTDLKTAKSRWSAREIDDHLPQLVIYREAVKDLARELGKPVKLAYEIVTKAKAPVVERHLVAHLGDGIERQAKIARLVVQAIETGLFVPTAGWQCTTCPSAGACRDWGH